MKYYPRPRKRFGQNFLNNENIIQHIIHSIQLKPQDKVIEIGPGLAALTKPLLQQLNRLSVIEVDKDIVSYLEEMFRRELKKDQLKIFSADALNVDYSQWGTQLRLVGNLPYNISTALLLHLLNFKAYIKDMHFMLQREVAQRLAADPGNKSFGRLSLLTQYYCEVQYLFDVGPENFFPPPKVHSAVIRLIPYVHSPYPPVDMNHFHLLITKAFSQRRKTLANNLKGLVSRESLASLGIDPSSRPEQNGIVEYLRMTQFLLKNED